MLTKEQVERIYKCPCLEEGVKCTESFRYHFNLLAHIEKEHKDSPEGKEIVEAHRIRSKKNNERIKKIKQEEEERRLRKIK